MATQEKVRGNVYITPPWGEADPDRLDRVVTALQAREEVLAAERRQNHIRIELMMFESARLDVESLRSLQKAFLEVADATH